MKWKKENKIKVKYNGWNDYAHLEKMEPRVLMCINERFKSLIKKI